MSDTTAAVGTRESGGTIADRDPKTAQNVAKRTAGYLGIGILIATSHYLFKCGVFTDHFQFIQPDDALLEMWGFLVLPPLDLIATIGMNWLRKQAGESA